MALYHASMKNISRGSRNTVGALAYRTGCKLVDARGIEDQERTVFDYQDKEVTHVELLLPEHSPDWAKELQQEIANERNEGVQHLCDLVEDAEIRKDARVYKELEFALPQELSKEQNRELAREFLQDQACGRGMAVLANFHCEQDAKTGEPKHHCHALFLTRRLEEHGLSCFKERDWDKKEMLLEMREQCAAYTNFHLQMNGFEQRVDHRSYEERGIELLPQPKMGRNVREVTARTGMMTDLRMRFEEVRLTNSDKLKENPLLALDVVSQTQPSFLWKDVQGIFSRIIRTSGLQDSLEKQIKDSKELVVIGEKEIVDALGHKHTCPLYTTQRMLQKEQSLLAQFHHLQNSSLKTQGFDLGQQKDILNADLFQPSQNPQNASLNNSLLLCLTHKQKQEYAQKGWNAHTIDRFFRNEPSTLKAQSSLILLGVEAFRTDQMEKVLSFTQEQKTSCLFTLDQKGQKTFQITEIARERMPSLSAFMDKKQNSVFTQERAEKIAQLSPQEAALEFARMSDQFRDACKQQDPLEKVNARFFMKEIVAQFKDNPDFKKDLRASDRGLFSGYVYEHNRDKEQSQSYERERIREI